jgi:hypothetical protein
MISLAFATVAKLIWFCQTFLPSNIVLRYFRHRDRLKWGALVGLAGAAIYYALFLVLSTGYTQWDWESWAHLVGIPVVLSLVKFTVFIPISAIVLARHRLRETVLLLQVTRELRRRAKADGVLPPEFTAQERGELKAWARQALASGT